MPHVTKDKERYWVNLADEKMSLYIIQAALCTAVVDMRDKVNAGEILDSSPGYEITPKTVYRNSKMEMPNIESVYVAQLDVTKDFKGFFYAR